MNWLGGSHILYVLYKIFYPILFSKNSKGDKLYFIITILVIINWYMLNGECLLTYLYKIQKNPNYKMGTDIFGFADINDLFKPLKIENFQQKTRIGTDVFFIYLVCSLFYINYRSKLMSTQYFLFLSLFTIYSYFIYKPPLQIIVERNHLQDVVKYSGIVYLTYMLFYIILK